MQARSDRFEGSAVAAAIIAGLVLMVGILVPMAPDLTEALRLIIRATARSSLLLFLLAFAAAAIDRLSDAPLAGWLKRNRRQMGIGFAVSHLIHLAAIVWLAQHDPVLFAALTTPASFIFGGLGYLFIVAMLATSFNATARAIGPRAWARLHTWGVWYIWLMFLINFGKRIPQHPSYTLAIILALAALALRLRARQTGRRQASSSTSQ
jgi:methionine sulfoxide reductase heme-binding subunit